MLYDALGNSRFKKFIKPILHSIILIPKTYIEIFKLFNYKEKKSSIITALSNDDNALTIPWYLKTSDSYKKYGFKNYNFEEALGIPFKGRFWFDYLPFEFFNIFGYRLSILTIFSLTMGQAICLAFYDNFTINKLIFLVLLVPSPLFTRSIFIYGKPESFSWVFFILPLYLCFGDNLLFVLLY